jgi:hypothetical protein
MWRRALALTLLVNLGKRAAVKLGAVREIGGAMQQIGRTERVWKPYWCELKGPQDPL